MTPEQPQPTTKPLNFIEEIMEADLASSKHEGRVMTRFPPEPNGYLHIGHAKSICINFGLAQKYGGKTNLRFDDTNPVKEDVEYVDSIREDVKWLGFSWKGEFFASDYFQQLYDYAEYLIQQGKAFVCDLSENEIREYRGNFYTPGRPSPFRERQPEENLELFRKMRAGEFPDGSKVLRAKIDAQHPNMNMRDPLMYRIRRARHHRTGNNWCIYPMYDYAHGVCDAIENITHSICTLEFEDHRPLYEWFLEQDKEEKFFKRPLPRQIEFARLNLTHTVMSKRRLLQLVQEGHVSGWDDPRMPTICGLRRRGYTPEAIRAFAERVGVAKRDMTAEVGLLEACIRECLEASAPRRMAVLHPLRLTVTNFAREQAFDAELPNHPEKPEMGSRKLPFSGELWIEQEDFMENPPKKWHRLSLGAEVRLRGACIIKCNEVVKDNAGNVIELRCTWDENSKGGNAADGRKIKGTIHWVSAAQAINAEVRLYGQLFQLEDPMALPDDQDWRHTIDSNSLEIAKAKLEPSLADVQMGTRFQFERAGYFALDPDSQLDRPIFNRVVGLKDSWAKIAGSK
ncbi:MAG: glutamine--tRNA ligase/YqeY domain fusion protein [Holophagales bacterium]|jgi:glutaminyl-tRNA synthetase|nr:glutamine--tRNA ligase/YqeY domain fusion protein [Holophagales bacterium]